MIRACQDVKNCLYSSDNRQHLVYIL